MNAYRTEPESARTMAHVVIIGEAGWFGSRDERIVTVKREEGDAVDWCKHYMRRVKPGNWKEVVPVTAGARLWYWGDHRCGFEYWEVEG